ncbi:organic hydroperoxide resistance protein [Xylophilus ampelinus]|uniref:Ohr subfamily peroxiredoxin n=1 Tax=Xylophilus ampelinus TaxID=54067 RepID=A0A318SYK7_9BURK|nr:organic hydroperoxide resistance protein [Xylophilus ampelinus]MCS4510268.1 organic hydroperoxide resistance protein [Xylophilus ampelinus]PYE78111.1 Ohr subfamily peroxiredoxin [Xylophilus ampelinus]
MVKKLEKVVYTAHAHTTGGREGTSKSDDGALSVTLSTPKAMGGAGGSGTNPEQLFAAGYSACFIGAMKAVSGKVGVKVPDDVSVDASVSFGPIENNAYGIAVKLEINLPGLDAEQKKKVVDAAHHVCPYSNATRDNVEVELVVA